MSAMFSNQPGSPGELNFRLGSMPVRIQPWFWLTSFVLAGPWFSDEPRPWPMILFVVACTVSILWHELGHAWTMRWFGARYVEIVLTGFGGYAFTHSRASRPWQRILIALAGPCNQLAAWSLLLAAIHLGPLNSMLNSSELANQFVNQLLLINLAWPLLNLIPIFPLDGGRVCRELGTSLLGAKGLKLSLYLSGLICSAMIIWIVSVGGSLFNALLFGMLLAQNIQELQALNEFQHFDDSSAWRS